MRALTSDVSNLLSGDNVPLLVLVQMDFVKGTLRVCNAGYNFIWPTGDFDGVADIDGAPNFNEAGEVESHTWIGLGALGSISGIQEGQDLQMYGCTLTLSGADPAMVAESMDPADYQGRLATIWLAPLSPEYRILSEPVITFQGRMDVMSVALGETATIQLTVESKLVDWERPRNRRYNHEDQISEYPGDMGFQFVPQMVEKELVWGRPS